MVVMGEFSIHLHLFYTFYAPHGYVLVGTIHHHTQVKIHQTKVATKHTY